MDIEIIVSIERETEAAYLVDDGDRTVWVPKSQVTLDPHQKSGFHSMFIPEWLAIEKELI